MIASSDRVEVQEHKTMKILSVLDFIHTCFIKNTLSFTLKPQLLKVRVRNYQQNWTRLHSVTDSFTGGILDFNNKIIINPDKVDF